MNKKKLIELRCKAWGIILEVSPDSARIKFDSLKTSRNIKAGFFKKVG